MSPAAERRAAAIRIDDIGERVPPGSQGREEVVVDDTSLAFARSLRLSIQRGRGGRPRAIVLELAEPLRDTAQRSDEVGGQPIRLARARAAPRSAAA